jgi:esterase/lipase superfamily enzyme
MVTLPPNHKTGEIESPDGMVFTFKPDPAKHVILESVTPLPKQEMLGQLRAAVKGAGRHEVFVFVHGFATTFEEAAKRTAQLAFDLDLLAVPVMYSWASQGTGSPAAYLTDTLAVVATAPVLKGFLEDLARETGATKIHVLAHSMGGRALSYAIKAMGRRHDTIFENVVLAAPDISAEVFRKQIVPAMSAAARKVTIYASKDDLPLGLSARVHNQKRLGQTRPTITVVTGFDTIDASGLPSDWLGHSYYAQHRAAIDDLLMMIKLGVRASERNLDPRGRGEKAYWRLK